MRCTLCKTGFPLRGAVHLPSQRLGMIPLTLCAGAVTSAQVDGLRALARARDGRLSCGAATRDGVLNWRVADSLIQHGLATARLAAPGARPYGVEISELGREVCCGPDDAKQQTGARS